MLWLLVYLMVVFTAISAAKVHSWDIDAATTTSTTLALQKTRPMAPFQGSSATCSNAIPLSCPSAAVAGNSGTATFDPLSLACPATLNSPGLWYYVDVPSAYATLTFSTCNNASFNTQLSLYKSLGNCVTLGCLTEADDTQGCSNLTTTLQQVPVTTGRYYLLVHGANGTSGNFGLSLSCGLLMSPANDNCSNAVPLSCPTTTVVGTTAGATLDASTVPACDPIAQQMLGVWYAVNISQTRDVTITACSAVVTNAVSVAVYLAPSGACGGLQCFPAASAGVGGQPGCYALSRVTLPSGHYFVRVANLLPGSSGNFTLTLSCAALSGVPGDSCTGALPLTCPSDSVTGSTAGASLDSPGPSCAALNAGASGSYTPYTSPNLWYYVDVATEGTLLTLSTCNDANFNTQLTVFQGLTGDCTALACVAAAGGTAGCAQLTTIAHAVAATTGRYYVMVDGFQGATGTFRLNMTCGLYSNCSGITCDLSLSGTAATSTFGGLLTPVGMDGDIALGSSSILNVDTATTILGFNSGNRFIAAAGAILNLLQSIIVTLATVFSGATISGVAGSLFTLATTQLSTFTGCTFESDIAITDTTSATSRAKFHLQAASAARSEWTHNTVRGKTSTTSKSADTRRRDLGAYRVIYYCGNTQSGAFDLQSGNALQLDTSCQVPSQPWSNVIATLNAYPGSVVQLLNASASSLPAYIPILTNVTALTVDILVTSSVATFNLPLLVYDRTDTCSSGFSANIEGCPTASTCTAQHGLYAGNSSRCALYLSQAPSNNNALLGILGLVTLIPLAGIAGFLGWYFLLRPASTELAAAPSPASYAPAIPAGTAFLGQSAPFYVPPVGSPFPIPSSPAYI